MATALRLGAAPRLHRDFVALSSPSRRQAPARARLLGRQRGGGRIVLARSAAAAAAGGGAFEGGGAGDPAPGAGGGVAGGLGAADASSKGPLGKAKGFVVSSVERVDRVGRKIESIAIVSLLMLSHFLRKHDTLLWLRKMDKVGPGMAQEVWEGVCAKTNVVEEKVGLKKGSITWVITKVFTIIFRFFFFTIPRFMRWIPDLLVPWYGKAGACAVITLAITSGFAQMVWSYILFPIACVAPFFGYYLVDKYIDWFDKDPDSAGLCPHCKSSIPFPTEYKPYQGCPVCGNLLKNYLTPEIYGPSGATYYFDVHTGEKIECDNLGKPLAQEDDQGGWRRLQRWSDQWYGSVVMAKHSKEDVLDR